MVKLYSETFGDSSQPAFVLIAGAMAPSHFWTDSFCETLSLKNIFVIRYDHRDTGLSPAGKWPYGLQELADDAVEVLDSYGIRAAYFVGHSMGGYVCQQLAIDYPDRVLGIAAISSGPLDRTLETSEEEARLLEQTWQVMLSREESPELEKRIEGFLPIWRYLNGSVPFDEEMARRYTRDLLTRTKHEFRAGNHHELVMRGVYESRSTETIEVPLLVIHGAEDPLVMPSEGAALAHSVKGATLKMVPGMGHMLFNADLERQVANLVLSLRRHEDV